MISALIRTDRLELRAPVAEDVRVIFDVYASDPRITKYMDWRPSRHVSEVERNFEIMQGNIQAGKCLSWIVRKLDEERLCGRVDLRLAVEEADIGYVLAASHWGQGIMPEAVSAVLDVGRSIGLRRVTGTCDPENRASARVFEKCGFRHVGTQKDALLRPALSDKPRDSECYEILLNDEPARRPE